MTNMERQRSLQSQITNGSSTSTFSPQLNLSPTIPASRSVSESRTSPTTSPAMRRSPSPSESALITSPSLDHSVRNGRSYQRNHASNPIYNAARAALSQRETIAQLSFYLQYTFLPSVQPAQQEYIEKEATRLVLEQLANTLLPGAELKAFGSTANGLSLRNSDMDLCCVVPKGQGPAKTASELVELLGTLIMQETNYQVKMLPRARIPIIKLTIPATPGSPFGMACDIGFDNMLALENTRLLWTYAMLEPRLRLMVLFIKVWTKRRKINNPYLGTLSSYGYALLVIFYLIHVRRPPLLPNLQRLPPTAPEERRQNVEIDGHNVYFYDDLEALQKTWIPLRQSLTETIGELLIGFFHYFSKDFQYMNAVISLRSETGLLAKDAKGWRSDTEIETEGSFGPRDLNRLCIEDPFQLDYNVARTVTRDGLFTIRGEFMRALRLLQGTSRAGIASMIAELCEEREEGLIPCPPGNNTDRRRSAPSPRIAPVGVPQVAIDFRLWAQAAQANLDPRLANLRSVLGPSSTSSTATSEDGLEQLMGIPPLPPPRSHLPYFQRAYAQTVRHGNFPSSRRQPSHQSNQISPPSLERRLSWDGSAEPLDIRKYFQAAPTSNQSLTAPASPTLPSSKAVLSVSPQQSTNSPTANSRATLAPTTSEAEVRPILTNGSAESRYNNLIKFGSFGSQVNGVVNGLGLFDDSNTNVEVEEDRRRPGMSRIDSERDIILFGDVRVVRRTASDGSRPSLSRRTSLPEVTESEGTDTSPLSKPITPPSLSTDEQISKMLAKTDLSHNWRTSLAPASL